MSKLLKCENNANSKDVDAIIKKLHLKKVIHQDIIFICKHIFADEISLSGKRLDYREEVRNVVDYFLDKNQQFRAYTLSGSYQQKIVLIIDRRNVDILLSIKTFADNYGEDIDSTLSNILNLTDDRKDVKICLFSFISDRVEDVLVFS